MGEATERVRQNDDRSGRHLLIRRDLGQLLIPHDFRDHGSRAENARCRGQVRSLDTEQPISAAIVLG